MKPTTLLGVPVLMAAALTTAAESRVLKPGFGDRDRWRIEADEPWWALVDIRDMLNLFHPFSVTATGSSAGASCELIIPAAWRPPFALRFYCADDYFADPDKHKPGQVGTESFFGHRFKQVLIDGDVVWERDVGDENTHGSQTVFLVDLTPHVTPGKPFALTCRVLDKLSTTERNDRDVWFIPGTWYAKGDGKTEQPPRFHTAVWFADPVLGERAAVEGAPAGRRPHEAVVEARHRARWPIPPPGEQMPVPVRLELVAPVPVPGSGFPVTCGIPMPPGMLTEPGAVRLRSAGTSRSITSAGSTPSSAAGCSASST